MDTIRTSPDCSDDLIGRSRYGRKLSLSVSLSDDPADHFLDVLGNVIVHVCHETPSKDHLGSSSI